MVLFGWRRVYAQACQRESMVFREPQPDGTALQRAGTTVYGAICTGDITDVHTGSSVQRSRRSCQFMF